MSELFGPASVGWFLCWFCVFARMDEAHPQLGRGLMVQRGFPRVGGGFWSPAATCVSGALAQVSSRGDWIPIPKGCWCGSSCHVGRCSIRNRVKRVNAGRSRPLALRNYLLHTFNQPPLLGGTRLISSLLGLRVMLRQTSMLSTRFRCEQDK